MPLSRTPLHVLDDLVAFVKPLPAMGLVVETAVRAFLQSRPDLLTLTAAEQEAAMDAGMRARAIAHLPTEELLAILAARGVGDA